MAGNLSNTPLYDPDDRKMDEQIMNMFKVIFYVIYDADPLTIEPHWLEHPWDHENLFEICLVRATEG